MALVKKEVVAEASKQETAQETAQETTQATKTETKKVVKQAEETTKPEAEKAEEQVAEQAETVKESEPTPTKEPEQEVENTKPEQIEDAEVAEHQAEETVEENLVSDQEVAETETDVADEQEQEEVKQPEQKTEVAVKPNTDVAKTDSKKATGIVASNVVDGAADEGFGGIELGFGSFPIITLQNEGQFCDSDENELGKHIRAELQTSNQSLMYVQEGVDEGPVGYSYDGITLNTFKGDEGEDYKTVEELKSAWSEQGYDMVCKKYLEVVATIHEDHEDVLDGDVPEGITDLEGEPVIFRVAPGSVRAFSGKVATLQMAGKPIKGALMDFIVGKKRKSGNNTYFPWKFRLVK